MKGGQQRMLVAASSYHWRQEEAACKQAAMALRRLPAATSARAGGELSRSAGRHGLPIALTANSVSPSG